MDETISDQIMEVTNILRDADDETKALFAQCFEAARKYLTSMTQFDPNGEIN